MGSLTLSGRVEPETVLGTSANVTEPISFGQRVPLLGAEAWATSQEAGVGVRWALRQPGGRYTVQLALLDGWGRSWGSPETPLTDHLGFSPEHWLTDEDTYVEYTLKLPAGIPPADYWFELALYDAASGARLPVLDANNPFRGVVFTSPRLSSPIPEQPLTATDVRPPITATAAWLDGLLVLMGHAAVPEVMAAGERIEPTRYWWAQEELPDGLMIRWILGDETLVDLPLSRAPSDLWEAGWRLREQYTIWTPSGLNPGSLPLRMRLVNADGLEVSGPMLTLAHITVQTTDRLYQLPPDMAAPLNYLPGEQIWLRCMAITARRTDQGTEIQPTLYWQAETRPGEPYTAFAHVLGPDNATATQADRWPADSPTDSWAPPQVITDPYVLQLPSEAPAGDYTIATGLYRATDGTRLPLVRAQETPAADDRLILPVSIVVGSPDGEPKINDR